MTKTQQAIAYLLNKSRSRQLSSQRIVFLVYLADWISALRNQQTITGEAWTFGHHGPDSANLKRAMASNQHFLSTFDDSQWPHRIDVRFVGKVTFDQISANETIILDYAAQLSDRVMFNQLTDMVYQTYPVTSPTRYETLDLVELAEELRIVDQAFSFQPACKGGIQSTAA